MILRRLRDTALRTACTVFRPVLGGLGCIVTLHRVIPDEERSPLPSNRALEITPVDLRAMLEQVRRSGIEVIALDGLLARLKEPNQGRFIAFTFDDGYRDNLTHALPVFREFGVPFAVNVTNGFISGTASVWWYFLEEVLAAGEPLRFSWDGREYQYETTGLEDRNRVLDEISGLLRSVGTPRDALIHTIAQAAGVDPCAVTRRLCMSWSELRELAADPLVTIGAHTAGHHSLNRLTEAEIVAEVEDARRELAAQLGREIRHFAYPFGGVSAAGEREFAIVRRSRFDTMLTTRAANLVSGSATLADQLPRVTVSGNYPALKALRMAESGLTAWREKRRSGI